MLHLACAWIPYRATGLLVEAQSSGYVLTLSAIYVETLANALLAHLLKHHCQHPGRTTVTFPPAEQFSATTLRQILEHIQEYLDHSLTLTELAEVVEMSPLPLCPPFYALHRAFPSSVYSS